MVMQVRREKEREKRKERKRRDRLEQVLRAEEKMITNKSLTKKSVFTFLKK